MCRAEFLALEYNRNQLIRIWNRVFPPSDGSGYGWDRPTMRIVYPEKLELLEDIQLALDLREGIAG